MRLRHFLERKTKLLLLALVCVLCLAVATDSLVRPSELPPAKAERTPPFKGVWINYSQFARMIHQRDEAAYLTQVSAVLTNLAELGINQVFLHVHSHSDSLFPSRIFPWSKRINGGEGVDYDPLALFIQQAHRQGVSVHAWFNPYRTDIASLDQIPAGHPVFSLRSDDCLMVWEDKVYLNPAAPQVQALVLDGVREVLENYPVDGIHYDDYFYPTTNQEPDATAYNQYCSTTPHPLSLGDWRRCQVNLLILATRQLVDRYPNVRFGVSPAANLENNYHNLYADVAAWVQGGYLDYLCPQLYFGFAYPKEEFQFHRLLQRWQTLAGECPLIIGLASYKVGQTDAQSTEWIDTPDLLARQTQLAMEKGCEGICLYSYDSLMQTDELSSLQRMHLAKVLSRLDKPTA